MMNSRYFTSKIQTSDCDPNRIVHILSDLLMN